ncbi:hypothetical protein MMC17_005057 [Xylographa soralifera]|nr:hypothetical protein [Xylographa soralifera]
MDRKKPYHRRVETLGKESDVLEIQREEFVSISENLTILSLFEDAPTAGGMIVENWSAVLSISKECVESLPGDDIAMCKFANSDSLGYQRASGHIMRLVRESVQTQAKIKSAPISALEAQVPTITMTSARVSARGSGRASITPAESTQHL